ncbi:hypothetical protein FA95DRAFT_1614003 [Auriscalpium vulgare]|uniref:Uncharacterized protein n=1 Tax=Auriscalpium vulgare TaxID=40419 RepID=A0ACB8R0S6_9AGAM|nr:hypothetical protein FA95DRAFT_1614003 [Auriscalpium vulgare]
MYWLSGEDVPLLDIIPASLSRCYHRDEPRGESITRLASELCVVAPRLQAAVVANDFTLWAEVASEYVDAVLDYASCVLSGWIVRHPAREPVAFAELDVLIVTWRCHVARHNFVAARMRHVSSSLDAYCRQLKATHASFAALATPSLHVVATPPLDAAPTRTATSQRPTALAHEHALDDVSRAGATSPRPAARARGDEEEERKEEGVRRRGGGRGDKPKGLEAGEQASSGAPSSPSPHPPSSPPPPYRAPTPATAPTPVSLAPARCTPVPASSLIANTTPTRVTPDALPRRGRADVALTLAPSPVQPTSVRGLAPRTVTRSAIERARPHAAPPPPGPAPLTSRTPRRPVSAPTPATKSATVPTHAPYPRVTVTRAELRAAAVAGAPSHTVTPPSRLLSPRTRHDAATADSAPSTPTPSTIIRAAKPVHRAQHDVASLAGPGSGQSAGAPVNVCIPAPSANTHATEATARASRCNASRTRRNAVTAKAARSAAARRAALVRDSVAAALAALTALTAPPPRSHRRHAHP